MDSGAKDILRRNHNKYRIKEAWNVIILFRYRKGLGVAGA